MGNNRRKVSTAIGMASLASLVDKFVSILCRSQHYAMRLLRGRCDEAPRASVSALKP
jgi:hypothetical protein